MVGGTLEGNPEAPVSGFAKIEEAGPGDLSFIANPKYAHYAPGTSASVLLVSEDFESPGPVSATLVKVADPYATLAALLRIVEQQTSRPYGKEEPAFIAANTPLPSEFYIGAFAYIGKNVKLGEGVRIYPQVYIG